MNKFEEFSSIAKNRQSVFPISFTGDTIEDAVLMSVLENANEAPTHKKSEPWRFHVVSGKSKVEFSKFMQSSYEAATHPDKFNELKYKKIAKKVSLSSHIVMIGCNIDPSFKLPKWEEVAATSCAVQNIYLSLTALGLGGYWSSPGYLINNANHFFKMGDDEISLGLFYIGVPKKELPPKPIKGVVADKVKWY